MRGVYPGSAYGSAGRFRMLGVLLSVWAGCLLLCSAPALGREVHLYKSSFGSGGAGPGEFDEPAGIAVNEVTHDVYVVDSGNNRVEEFDSTGASIGEFSPPGGFSDPTEIAIDNSVSPSALDPSKEDVYVVDTGQGVIDKFSPNGTYLNSVTGTPKGKFEPGLVAPFGIAGIAVDTNGTVWISTLSHAIYRFNDSLVNEYISQWETPDLGEPEKAWRWAIK